MSELVSVNVGTPRPITYRGKTVMTSIFKEPVSGRVAIEGVNVAGDDQADREVHGGYYKAVYAYAAEDYEWWSGELGHEVGPGTFGDNLTLKGIDVNGARIGDRWRVGSAVLQVTEPRFPCFKLGAKMGTQGFVKQFAQAQRPGTYLAILEEGEAGPGDPVEIISTADHDVTIGLFAAAYLDRSLRYRLLAAPTLSPNWRAWAEDQPAAESSER
jgi:MOSC domain-containing protein YiiM